MKSIVFLFTLVSSIQSWSQVSYDFNIVVPPNKEVVTAVDAPYFGKYKSDENGPMYEFSATGVTVHSINMGHISRKLIRESSVYSVRDGYIFGVVQNDSVPCMLKGDDYYFGVRTSDVVIGPYTSHKLVKISANKYMLNYNDQGKYIPLIITFVNKGMEIRQFDYSPTTTQFNSIESKIVETKEIEIIHLSPTREEWETLNMNQIFSVNTENFKLED